MNDQSINSPKITAERTESLKGLTPLEALEQYDGELTSFEMSELTTYDYIYTVGSVRVKSMRQT